MKFENSQNCMPSALYKPLTYSSIAIFRVTVQIYHENRDNRSMQAIGT